ncbi:MAG: bacteriohopanetetrol glucosamine biosynthesis glycosyltransferase HpnI [Acidobacteriota bacterium]|nr:bacteriohopanetetrol glucosamine biosynthesis glycosyltransferase HpnI [Acidobacteriota bacterium]
MDLAAKFAAAAALCALAYYLICLWSARGISRQTEAAAAGPQLAVSILKPLRGADPELYQALRSHCTQDYSEYEVLLGVSDAADLAVPVAQQLAREFPSRVRLLICPEVLGANRKVSNLIQMLAQARHSRLLINDSDIQVPPDYLRRIFAHFEDPAVGMVTSLYRGSASGTLGSRLEALGISTDFIPGVLAARQLEGVSFGLGCTLAMSRKALDGIGGFQPIVDYLADDYELGHRIASSGMQVVLSKFVVETQVPAYSLGGFFQHQLRWARTVRHARPASYFGMALSFGQTWALLALVLSHCALWAWSLLGITVLVRWMMALAVGVGVLGDRQVIRSLWLIPLRDFLSVLVWLGSYAGRRIHWRGEDFILEKGKLRPA